jgi:uncharacterized damage-inducible protein DinB
MKLSELFLSQLEAEAPLTRRMLERFPEGREEWKPHERSMSLGRLATLVSDMSNWIVLTVKQDQLDLAPTGGAPYAPRQATTARELVETHDVNIAAARAALAGVSDEELSRPWSLMYGGKVMWTQPKFEVLRDSVFSHLAHHRGQLTVYLRLNEVPVPPIYGQTADEGR